MYNSELWTLTKGLEEEIDIFHRKLIHKMFNIKWQDKISNKELYAKFKIKPWSLKIKERKLRMVWTSFEIRQGSSRKKRS